jgi:uncharacterized protein with NRDE domain
MCLLGIAFRQFEDAPLLILANREEEWDRPSTGPAIMPRQVGFPAWVGGTDRLAGGTWLGVNEHGLVVAVTNRPKQSLPPEPPSRGLLCRSLLRFANVPAASEHAWQELRSGQFAGCNLILVSRDQGVVIHAGDELGRVALSPGLNLITNGDLEDPRDRRIARVRRTRPPRRVPGICQSRDRFFNHSRPR